MSKIDPNLLASLEQLESQSEDDREIQVIVGLRTAADPSTEADLARRGLMVRSRAGDVLTGSVRLGNVRHLAEAACIVKIEASTPLYPEGLAGEGGEG
jgi:hypothetical protein